MCNPWIYKKIYFSFPLFQPRMSIQRPLISQAPTEHSKITLTCSSILCTSLILDLVDFLQRPSSSSSSFILVPSNNPSQQSRPDAHDSSPLHSSTPRYASSHAPSPRPASPPSGSSAVQHLRTSRQLANMHESFIWACGGDGKKTQRQRRDGT